MRASGLVRVIRAAAVIAVLSLCSACTTLFFHPSRSEFVHPQKLGLKHEDVYLTTADGVKLHGWYLPAVGEAKGSVLHLHGNAENISSFLGAVYWLPAKGYNVFLLDYRGYGRSEGIAEVAGIHADSALALDYMMQRGGVDRDRLVVFGQSLGGSVALNVVARSPHRARLRAVISEGAFASYRRIAREKMQLLWLTRYLRWPLGFLFTDDYAAEEAVAAIAPVPLWIIHGDADQIVPVEHADALYSKAADPKEKWIVPGGRHVDSLTRAEGRQRFLAQLERLTAAVPQVAQPP